MKCLCLSTELLVHAVISQNTLVFILTTVRTIDPPIAVNGMVGSFFLLPPAKKLVAEV